MAFEPLSLPGESQPPGRHQDLLGPKPEDGPVTKRLAGGVNFEVDYAKPISEVVLKLCGRKAPDTPDNRMETSKVASRREKSKTAQLWAPGPRHQAKMGTR